MTQRKQTDDTDLNFLFKNVTEKLPLLGLARLNFLPMGFSVDKVGESELCPNMPSELIGPQLAFTRSWRRGHTQETESQRRR